MVSASRYCLPLMRMDKDTMVKNLEAVSYALVQGPYGTIKYMQLLRNPVSGVVVTSVTAPTPDTTKWKGEMS